ncbi:hypothetical protein GOM49_14685 [Clostridium bovifaecis]|uniref:Peptidoglycan binding-like domain-containing protein n=1 Tax=Clostridium bovifaecis TaxID=2184719 RepID=A0A6I6F6T7_9CLOT|nr:hypothetical protein GOM49_14685 [Clostridium bovifaecis]
MKKTLATVACALAMIMSLPVIADNSRLGQVGVDVVSAATGDAVKPAQTTPKPGNTTKKPITSKVSTTSNTSTEVKRLLTIGSSGSDVKLLQTMLNNNGYKLKADGIFGKQTLDAVKSYQSKNGLTADGIVGPKTLAKLSPAKPAISINRLLKVGSRGSDVELLQTMLNKNGYKLNVDGIFGKLTLDAVKNYQSKNALTTDGIVGPKTLAKLNAAKVTTTTPSKTETSSAAVGKTSIKIGRAEFAAHGTKCFTVAVVAMAGDKIVGASIDDYQFISTDVAIGVPNSDADFGKNYRDSKVALASKRTNTKYYSEHMKEEAGATTPIDKSYDSIQTYVKGKTIAQLEATLSKNTKEQMVDAVSGATLADTHGYISAIVAAAKNTKENSSIQIDTKELDKLKMGRVEYAAHGTKCFTVAVSAVIGDKVVAASIDDYQFISKDLVTGVPNSDADFGKNYKDPNIVLASKRTNTKYYSEHMKEEAGATTPIDKSYDAIQAYVSGKTIAQLEATLSKNTKEQMVDAVSGATLADTYGYTSAIVAAAKAANKVEVPEVDAVTTASTVNRADALTKALSKDGTWIVATLGDITVDKEIVVEGEFYNKNDKSKGIYRKLAPYTQDEKHNVLERFTITVPKMTIRSENFKIQAGVVKGDIYVEAKGFTLTKDATIDGSIYYTSEDLQKTAIVEGKVTGKQEVK